MIKTPLSTMIGGAFWTPNATILGGTSKTFGQLIKHLFAGGEDGFFCDPNDLSTMFQDAAGTVPVTGAGQPVGLILDKSRGLVLGSELVINGDFSSGTSGWSPVGSELSIVDGKLQVVTLTDIAGFASQAIPTTIGKWYELSVDITLIRGSIAAISVGTSRNDVSVASVGSYSNGKFTLRFLAKTATSHLILQPWPNQVGQTCQFGNVSVKTLSGNHAYQTQSAMRPLLVANPQRLDYDIADDKLVTKLPAQLTGCTVIRSVPNVGTQILTNQTIPATCEDNTDHCGLIVINRALTASETSAITSEFDKRAGV